MVVDSPHLRADAQRNLGRILEAARAVFAEAGRDASVADVAERAEVGTATIFRRFPTKDDLVLAVLERELEEINAQALAAAGADEPVAAIGSFMEWAVETLIEDRCLCEASGSDLFTHSRLEEKMTEVRASIGLLLRRAQDAGAIRDDIVAEDIGVLINAVAQAGRVLEATAPGAWRRYLSIVHDGLRSAGAHPLAAEPPTPQQVTKAKSESARRRS